MGRCPQHGYEKHDIHIQSLSERQKCGMLGCSMHEVPSYTCASVCSHLNFVGPTPTRRPQPGNTRRRPKAVMHLAMMLPSRRVHSTSRCTTLTNLLWASTFSTTAAMQPSAGPTTTCSAHSLSACCVIATASTRYVYAERPASVCNTPTLCRQALRLWSTSFARPTFARMRRTASA